MSKSWVFKSYLLYTVGLIIWSLHYFQLWVCQVPPSVCGALSGECGRRRNEEPEHGRRTACNWVRTRRPNSRHDAKDERLSWVSVSNHYSLAMCVRWLGFIDSLSFFVCNRYQQMLQTLKNAMIVVMESLINKFEEDQLRKEELHQEKQHIPSSSQYTDNCSDSDSSFNQVRDRADAISQQ